MENQRNMYNKWGTLILELVMVDLEFGIKYTIKFFNKSEDKSHEIHDYILIGLKISRMQNFLKRCFESWAYF